MDINDINRRILELCEEKGWSEYKLAKESGIPNSSLNSIFKNNHTPNFYTLQKICEGLQIPLSHFFDSKLFSNIDTPVFLKLWNSLDDDCREKVLIYMYGLLRITVPKEGLKNEIQRT